MRKGFDMKILLALLVLITCSFSGSAFALAAQPDKLIFCHEDENAFPWVFNQNEQSDGLDIRLIKLLANDLGIEITLRSLPWKRCLLHLQTGLVDGAFAASYRPERLTMGMYPTKGNKEQDVSKRIHISSYYLYTAVDSKLTWDGQEFSNLSGDISVQLGFSISGKLEEMGVSVNEVKGPERALKDVLSELSQGAALQAERADYILSSAPSFDGRIKKHKIILTEKPYYLMLSFNLTNKYSSYSQYIWERLALLRDSKTMESISRDFWQQR
jgi:polar amino acid transport system substrate-binding protein